MKRLAMRCGGVGTLAMPTIAAGADAYNAGPSHGFDLEVAFAMPNPQRFGAGESVTLNVTGIAGLVASDFAYESAGATVVGPRMTGVHVQGIGNGSAWVSVPEPGSAALLAAGSTLVLSRRRR